MMKELPSKENENESKKPTEAQRATSQIAFFLDVQTTARTLAKAELQAEKLSVRKRRKRTKEMVTALTDLYVIRSHKFPIEPFIKKWGEEDATYFEKKLDTITPQLDEQQQRRTEAASELTRWDRTKIATRAVRKLNKLPPEQKEALLQMAGFTKEEANKIAKKMGTSGVLTLITGSVANVWVGGSVVHEAFNHSAEVGTITDPKVFAATVISYAAHYGPIAINAYTNYRLLKSNHINTCPNILATGLYYLLPKMFPEKKRRAEIIGTAGGTVSWALWQELFTASALFTPGGAELVQARNYAGGVFNMSEAGVNTIWQAAAEKIAKKKDKKN